MNIQQKTIGAYNKVIAKGFFGSARLFLLKRGGHSDAFTSIREITEGWYYKRSTDEFSIASTDTDFFDDWREATHFGYGTTAPFDVYEMDDAQKTETQPNEASPFYLTVATLDRDESFTP
jgi:hypothetical protein